MAIARKALYGLRVVNVRAPRLAVDATAFR
jgi:hypothetical protein